jgi:hypothetical protein
MAKLVLSGATSGSISLESPAVSGTTTLTLPTSSGTITVAGVNSNIVSSTSQATTSGTSKDFTGIPSWVKRITVMFSGVSTNGSSHLQLQIGDSGGIETSGYNGSAGYGTNYAADSSGFLFRTSIAAGTLSCGHLVLTYFGSNTWVQSGVVGAANSDFVVSSGGYKTLSDTLTQIRITTVNGTDTFDAGSVNILYE